MKKAPARGYGALIRLESSGFHTRSLILQRLAKVSGEVARMQPEICVGLVRIPVVPTQPWGQVEVSRRYLSKPDFPTSTSHVIATDRPMTLT